MTPPTRRRLGVVDDAGRGTPTGVWEGWADDLPDLDLGVGAGPPWRDVVVVAPHPDDEVLGVGGLMRHLVRSGASLRVVAVTDGDAARPPAGWSPQRLGIARTLEATAACAELGVPGPRRLALPDGRVAAHENALTEAVADLLRPDTVCLATWRHDGHPDHEATGRAVAAACTHTGARLVEYPVWMWHWARPGDPDVPWARARRWVLPGDDLDAKARAVAHHHTQLEAPAAGVAPVLPPFVVERLVTRCEMVLV